MRERYIVCVVCVGHRAALIGFLVVVAGAADGLSAVVRFEDFVSAQGLGFSGAAAVSGNALRLTPAKRNKTGAVWLREKQLIGKAFETTFQFQLTEQSWVCKGADGFAFVMQNSGPAALGGRGSAGGFGVADYTNHRRPGIPWSIAVFFDTCQNAQEGDPSANNVAIRTNGRPADMRWPAERLAVAAKLSFELKDRRVHTARIKFDPPVMTVFLDGAAAPALQGCCRSIDRSGPTGKGMGWIYGLNRLGV